MRKLLASTALCLALSGHGAFAQNQFSSLTVFGDSLSANAAIGQLSSAFVPAPPYYMGRFSNGPVYAEYLNNLLGITGGFTDKAVGGAYSAPLNETLGVVPVSGTNINATLSSLANPNPYLPFTLDTSVQGQILAYLASGAKPSASGLYIVWGGANDYLNMAGTIGAQPSLTTTQITAIVQQQVTTTVTNLTNDVGLLAKAGAKNFIVPVLPNLGGTPSLNGSAASAQLGQLTSSIGNSALATAMGQVAQQLGVKIFLVDTASVFADIEANPGKYGVSNVTTACVQATSVCANPSANLFWDSVHPTAGIHQILAEVVTATVDAPLVIGAQGKLADAVTQTIFDAVSSRVNALQQGANGFAMSGPGGAYGHVDSNNPLSFYVSGDYGMGTRDNQANETGFRYTNGAIQAGADYRADDNFAFGLQAGFSSANANLKDGMGTDDMRSYSLAVYGATFGKNWYGSLSGFYAYQDWDKLDRNTYVVNQVASAATNGTDIGAKLEGGYMLHLDSVNVGPTADLRIARININAYSEHGAVGVNEAVDNQSYSSIVSEIGGQISTDIGSDGAIFRPTLRVTWDHQYAPLQRHVFSELASLPQASIDTALPSAAEDWARVGLGLSYQANAWLNVVADLDGTVGRADGQDYNGMVRLLCHF